MRAFKLLLLAFVVCLWIPAPSVASDQTPKDEQTRDQEDTAGKTDDDLNALRRAAAAEAEKETEEEDGSWDTTFKSGNLSLQALNPEFSVTGDMLGNYQSGRDEVPSWDTSFRTLGLHLEAYLDPYSRFKASLPVAIEGMELGEAYFTRYGFLAGFNITLGKFRQQFGVVNRWHKHALDWFDFPLPLRAVFGPGGLNQVGVSIDRTLATGSQVHELVIEVTDADNPVMFGHNSDNRPSILAHYKSYRDLTPSTYFELGLTGLVGWNDDWSSAIDTSFSDAQRNLYAMGDARATAVYGADLTVLWEPTGRMRYRNFQWRTEAYLVDADILAPDGSGADRLHPWGAYSLVQARVSRTIEVGVRYDYFAPDAAGYVLQTAVPTPAPLSVVTGDAYRQLVGGWITWWQSPFVKFRGGYAYESGDGTGRDLHYVTLQTVFAAGPHKHERY